MGPGLERQYHDLNDELVSVLIFSVQATGTTSRRQACDNKHVVCRLLSHSKYHQTVILSNGRVFPTPPPTNYVRQSESIIFSLDFLACEVHLHDALYSSSSESAGMFPK